MITLLIAFGPLPIFIAYAVIRARIQRRKLTDNAQTPPADAKEYEPESVPRPNFFLRFFSSKTRFYLRQQWSTARFGFIVCTWVSTCLLCGSLLPSSVESHHLATFQQQVWFSYLTSAGEWTFLLVFFAIITVMVTSVTLVLGTAGFYRTLPITLRTLFWVRVLSALATLVLSAAVSIGISFATMRIAYGPVWDSSPHVRMVMLGTHHSLINLDDDETPEQAMQRRLGWLANNKPGPRLTSAVTDMLLVFGVMLIVMTQPLGAKASPQTTVKWIPILAGLMGFALFRSAKSLFGIPAARFLFYSGPFDPSPTWRYFPVPIVLIILLLFVSERLYIRRDV